jgi:ribonucleoside-diphosphate reductase alpha chain/ribonucleoside-triphosphate reductase
VWNVTTDCDHNVFWGGWDEGLTPKGRHKTVFLNSAQCGEITLSDREPCNLSDIYLPNIQSVDQFKRVAYLLYKACKTISNCEFSDPITDAIVKENHRLGIGLTGYMAAPRFHNAQILTAVYRYIEEADLHYSGLLHCGRSIKLTTIKPSGTLSLLPANCTPGMHAAFSQFLIRRIRFSSSDPLIEVCRRHGYPVEPQLQLDGSIDPRTMVVSFPMKFSADVRTESQMNVIDELEVQKHLQTYWSDNSVSATHYFKEGELPNLKKWLTDNYEESVKACSFLLSQGHGFKQAPLEAVSEEQYERMKSKCKTITSIHDEQEMDLVDSMECGSGGCPVK